MENSTNNLSWAEQTDLVFPNDNKMTPQSNEKPIQKQDKKPLTILLSNRFAALTDECNN